MRHYLQAKEMSRAPILCPCKIMVYSLYVWLWRLVLLFLVVLGYTLSGDDSVGAAEQPDRGGTIIWAVHEGMPHFDIHVEGSYILAQPVGPLYNSLLTFDLYNNEKIVGDLAERWEVAPDGKQITFALRQGVKFHDGSAFTCADAKYSLEKLADPKRSYRGHRGDDGERLRQRHLS